MWAATRMGAPEAPAAIAAVMSDGQTPDAVREAARDCLLSTKGKVVADLAAAAVQDGSPAGQVDALSILSERRATDKADIVLAATGSNNAEVATAAFTPHCKMSWERVSSRRSIRWSDRPTVYACRWPSRR